MVQYPRERGYARMRVAAGEGRWKWLGCSIFRKPDGSMAVMNVDGNPPGTRERWQQPRKRLQRNRSKLGPPRSRGAAMAKDVAEKVV